MPLPRSGDVLHVTRAASVQFAEPIYFRVIRVHDWPTYHGWVWLDGYELNPSGDAVERRSIFVQINGLRHLQTNAGRHNYPQARRPALTNSNTLAARVRVG
ncbi:hypothetical protein V1634_30340 [Plantactinospora veratri]|uniref:Uncharacterized protein n=1 Tax=Plantactinospora veratri TaxID=1436122 RepID=A0ABU7SMG9_9ACTN